MTRVAGVALRLAGWSAVVGVAVKLWVPDAPPLLVVVVSLVVGAALVTADSI